MTDIDRLTLVIAGLGTLLIARIPENPAFKKWGFIHLTLDLLANILIAFMIVVQVFTILGIGGFHK